MRYLPNAVDDRRDMLASIGASSIEALFSDIPQSVRSRFQPIGLPAKSEMEVGEAS